MQLTADKDLQMTVKLLQQTAFETWCPVRQALAEVARGMYDAGQQERVLRDLYLTSLYVREGITLPTAAPYNIEPVSEERRWLVCAANVGETVEYARVFHPLLLDYAARHQLQHCPVFDDHKPYARPAQDYLGFLDEALFDAPSGRLFARLNVKNAKLQARLLAVHRAGAIGEVKFSFTLRPYMVACTNSRQEKVLEYVLAQQIRSLDVVPRAGCRHAQALGAWADREAVFAHLRGVAAA